MSPIHLLILIFGLSGLFLWSTERVALLNNPKATVYYSRVGQFIATAGVAICLTILVSPYL